MDELIYSAALALVLLLSLTPKLRQECDVSIDSHLPVNAPGALALESPNIEQQSGRSPQEPGPLQNNMRVESYRLTAGKWRKPVCSQNIEMSDHFGFFSPDVEGVIGLSCDGDLWIATAAVDANVEGPRVCIRRPFTRSQHVVKQCRKLELSAAAKEDLRVDFELSTTFSSFSAIIFDVVGCGPNPVSVALIWANDEIIVATDTDLPVQLNELFVRKIVIDSLGGRRRSSAVGRAVLSRDGTSFSVTELITPDEIKFAGEQESIDMMDLLDDEVKERLKVKNGPEAGVSYLEGAVFTHKTGVYCVLEAIVPSPSPGGALGESSKGSIEIVEIILNDKGARAEQVGHDLQGRNFVFRVCEAFRIPAGLALISESSFMSSNYSEILGGEFSSIGPSSVPINESLGRCLGWSPGIGIVFEAAEYVEDQEVWLFRAYASDER